MQTKTYSKPEAAPGRWVRLGSSNDLYAAGHIKHVSESYGHTDEGCFYSAEFNGSECTLFESQGSEDGFNQIWGHPCLMTSLTPAKRIRPVQKFGESIRDYDNRLAEYRAGMKKHQGTLAETLRNEAESLGMRFVLSELKDDFRELVLSIPIEAEAGQIKALEFFATNYVEAGVTVRSVVFPYK